MFRKIIVIITACTQIIGCLDAMQNQSASILFNKDTGIYRQLANDAPGYPITLKPGDTLDTVNFNNKYSANNSEKFDSVDAYFTIYSEKGGAIAPVTDQKKQKEMLTYAVREKIKSYRYLLYKLMLTGKSSLQYQPTQENKQENFYAQNLGPILEEIRAERTKELHQSTVKKIQNSLQSIRFGSWDWFANKWHSIMKK